jgi:hypothetical protein
MTTDPTLAALLADPDPTARLIAADRCAELGDDLGAAVVHFAARQQLAGIQSSTLAVGRRTVYIPSEWLVDPLRVLNVRRPKMMSWSYDPCRGWCRYFLRRGRHCIHFAATLPPGLEGAVLAVLRKRLAEVRQG